MFLDLPANFTLLTVMGHSLSSLSLSISVTRRNRWNKEDTEASTEATGKSLDFQ